MSVSARGRIAISVTQGRTVRDLFFNGLLEKLGDLGYSTTVFTEADAVDDFTTRFASPTVDFERLYPVGWSRARHHAYSFRKTLRRSALRPVAGLSERLERRLLYAPPGDYVRWLGINRPGALLATHVMSSSEAELVEAARRVGVPTLGLVQSWDNVVKGIQTRTDRVLVWNEINAREMTELEGVPPGVIDVTGGPQFDTYFDESVLRPRSDVLSRLGLDPDRPVILYASLGSFVAGFDETIWMDSLVEMLDQWSGERRPQVICRLHPWSRSEHFARFREHPDVELSVVDRYWPCLGWYMTREDVGDVANLLAHADVVVSPGSTMVLEAAIFDRPTIVPVFHDYQPERAESYFRDVVMTKHFRRIMEEDLLPVVTSSEQMRSAIIRAIEEPDWYGKERRQLVADYIHRTDGRAVDRVAAAVDRLAQSRRD